MCQECGTHLSVRSDICAACGSRRLVFHPEITTLSIAHVDCDAFFCSVEKRDNPELINKPVIVGGGKRGVVAAACYNARIFGIRSAMPMFKALKACPDVVVIRPNMQKYVKEGARIKQMMLDLTPMVEPLSIDEAFLDLTGTQRLHAGTPAQTLVRLQHRILQEVGVTVSIGLSYNKFLAKTASDLDKPHGFAVLGRADALDFLAPKPVEFVFGVGPAFARSLKKRGIVTIADVRKRSDSYMMKTFGEAGFRLARLARAEDTRTINPISKRKSISTEITFNKDLQGFETLSDKLWQVCVKTSDRAKAKTMAGRVVTLKLKTAHFQSLTRRRKVAEAVQLADELFRICLPLLEAETAGRYRARKFRLIGVGISELCPPSHDHGDLLDPTAISRRRAERASDLIREKFGKSALVKGRVLRQNPDKGGKPEKG
ncbi:MAG TPA: DNA polymerase IV [Hellea balneolensis]|uniref:DNA polymerase IV n=1 Tax=Hellea balneolensis TaxID=287478 RepID=A0A7C5R3S7_9PROT|nr:DNA polymerase IV [Hellea balneolensis]